ncbi:MAG: hypothetical protein IKE76_10195 [Clostridia bacterium]|nr:hypothetical protein [Clostridia bacterium]
MKKILCVLTALAMLLCGLALAEAGAPDSAVIDRFSDTWVDDYIAVEIWYEEEDGAFHCSAVKGDGGDESEVWEYGSCAYDAATDSLVCADGVRARESYDEAADAPKSETLAEGLTAEFRFAEGEDRLLWVDSEGLAADYRLARLSDAEEADYQEAQSYVGRWVCERAAIDIADTGDDTYGVSVVWGNSAFDQTEWHYACLFDINRHLMYSSEPGTKEIVGCDENGARNVLSTEYGDGAATFALDDGMLIWDDAKEHVAEGMRFERGVDPGEFGNAQKVIAPMDVDVDLSDGTYPVGFDREDVKDGGIADVSIYTVDCYDIVDVAQMAVGDAFTVEGVTVEITSLERGDDGSVIINGGMDGDGYVLRAFDEDNCYKVVETDDFNTYTERSVQTLPFAEDVVYTDGWDIEKDPVTVTGIEAVIAAIAESEDEYYDPYSTEMRFADGKIAEINRQYVP